MMPSSSSCSAASASASASVSVSGMKRALALDFVPRPEDVIVGRQGRSTKAHNRHFTSLIEEVSDEYSEAANKASKSRILLGVVNQVQNKGGMFVRRDLSTGRWYMVENSVARTTAAQLMRDSLHQNYKSSRQFKQQRRQQQEQLQQQMQKKTSKADSAAPAATVTPFTVLEAASIRPQFPVQQPQPLLQPQPQPQPQPQLKEDSNCSLSFPWLANDCNDNIAIGSLDFPSLLSAGDGGSDPSCSAANTASFIQDADADADADDNDFKWNFDLTFSTKNILQQSYGSTKSCTATTTVVSDDSCPCPSNSYSYSNSHSHSTLFSILSATFGPSSDRCMRDENPFEPTPISSVLEEQHLANGLDDLISREI